MKYIFFILDWMNTLAATSCYCSNWLERSCLLSKPCTIPLPLCGETLTLNSAPCFLNLLSFCNITFGALRSSNTEYLYKKKLAMKKCSIDPITVCYSKNFLVNGIMDLPSLCPWYIIMRYFQKSCFAWFAIIEQIWVKVFAAL